MLRLSLKLVLLVVRALLLRLRYVGSAQRGFHDLMLLLLLLIGLIRKLAVLLMLITAAI